MRDALGAALGAAVVVAALVLLSRPAAAQDAPVGDDRDARIGFEVGDFDDALGDFPVTAVVVSGGLTDGQEFTVELRGEGDRLVWTATRDFSAPSMRIEVDDRKVGVAEVLSAGLAQAQQVLDVEVVPPQAPSAVEGTGGSGQLTLSMVVTIIVVIVVFRSPLPSAQTSRWTK